MSFPVRVMIAGDVKEEDKQEGNKQRGKQPRYIISPPLRSYMMMHPLLLGFGRCGRTRPLVAGVGRPLGRKPNLWRY